MNKNKEKSSLQIDKLHFPSNFSELDGDQLISQIETEELPSEENFEDFKKHYRHKDYALAKEALEKIKKPSSTYYYYNGLLHFQNKNMDKALEAFKKSVSSKEENFVTEYCLLFLAYIYINRGNLRLADQYLEDLLALGSTETSIFSMKAYIAMENKEPSKALAYYDRVYEVGEGYEILNNMAYALMMSGNLEEGFRYVQKSMAKEKNYANLHTMGYYYLLKRDFKNAILYLEESFALKPHPLTKQHLEKSHLGFKG